MIESEAKARKFVAALGDHRANERLELLCEWLIAENRRQNLISRSSEAHIWQRHIADSAQLLTHVSRETDGIWLDLGTGAGFPGLVIAILEPGREVVLVESRRRRADWLGEMSLVLELENCRVEHSRLELLKPFAARFISARAFAPMPKLLSLSARFSTRQTRFLLPKGRSAAQELGELPEASARLFHVEQSLTDPEAGILVGGSRN